MLPVEIATSSQDAKRGGLVASENSPPPMRQLSSGRTDGVRGLVAQELPADDDRVRTGASDGEGEEVVLAVGAVLVDGDGRVAIAPSGQGRDVQDTGVGGELRGSEEGFDALLDAGRWLGHRVREAVKLGRKAGPGATIVPACSLQLKVLPAS